MEVHLGPEELRAAMEHDVVTGLTSTQKWLPPVWFYDETGSRLFDAITRLPEYYPTRSERSILEDHALEIIERAAPTRVVELGSGTSEKTRLLLDALVQQPGTVGFTAFDVSEEILREAAAAIAAAYPALAVHAIVGDFQRHLSCLAGDSRMLVVFLGGTIGNLAPQARSHFLAELRSTMGAGCHLLLGTDLVKDPARLVAAYDDGAGVTAAFNRNLLVRLNRELGADFDPGAFDHIALWNEAEEWIEMRLRSRVSQVVHVAALGLEVRFHKGEDLLTEISAKFKPEGVAAELAAAGLSVVETWSDAGDDFLLTLAAPACYG